MNQNHWRSLLEFTAERGIQYLDGVRERPVAPGPEAIRNIERLGGAMPEHPLDPIEVIRLLDEAGSPASVANAGGRFFGFVNGGALPAPVAANWLAGIWDQNAGLGLAAPGVARIEDIVSDWLVDVLSLPAGTAGGFVTGATMANFTGLLAARHEVLAQVGWDAERNGLFGAPEITVVAGEEIHASMLRALAMVGLGRERILRVPTDRQGRIQPGRIPDIRPPAIVCLQAGNVNTGAFDPAGEICERAHRIGAWIHVDGAFGMWASASPSLRHLMDGFDAADSWATDCHKWLNVPYDSGVAFVRKREILESALAYSAAYLVTGGPREPMRYTPEMSRRARAVEVWAALRSLGRSGLAQLIDTTCRHARRFAAGLRDAGYEVLNDVVLNQVLVSFGDPDKTKRAIAAIQEDGTCWCGGTVWQGHTAMRISVSSWVTNEADVEKSLAAILRIAASV